MANDNITDVISHLTDVFQALTATVGLVAAQLLIVPGQLIQALTPATVELAAMEEELEDFGTDIEGMSEYAEILQNDFNDLIEKVEEVGTALVDTWEQAVSVNEELSSLADELSEITGLLDATNAELSRHARLQTESVKEETSKGGGGLNLGSLVAGLGAVAAVIAGTVFALESFVKALNPNLIEAFNFSLRDLSATIGVAFAPLFVVLRDMVNQISGYLLPVMQQLAPIVEEVGAMFASSISNSLTALLGMAQAILPLIQVMLPLLDILSAFGELMSSTATIFSLAFLPLVLLFKLLEVPLKAIALAFREMARLMEAIMIVINAVVKAIVDVVAGWFGGAKQPMADFKSAMENLIAQFVIFAALLAKTFGFDAVVDNLSKTLNQQRITAAGATSVTNLETIVKDLNKSAFAAVAGGGGKEQEADWRQIAAEALKKIAEGKTDSWIKKIADDVHTIAHPIEALGSTKTGRLALNSLQVTARLLLGPGASHLFE